jgi:Pyruvate/2-oxoacid:ferredoxin oxidoreductase gamma subunit
MRKSVVASVPKGTEELNLKAFDRGYEHGMKMREEGWHASLPAARA